MFYTDFGLSRFLEGSQSHISDARQGTPYYIAPEVCEKRFVCTGKCEAGHLLLYFVGTILP